MHNVTSVNATLHLEQLSDSSRLLIAVLLPMLAYLQQAMLLHSCNTTRPWLTNRSSVCQLYIAVHDALHVICFVYVC